MQSYKYTAISPSGQSVNGFVDAFDEIEATAKIRNEYGTVLRIEEIGAKKTTGLYTFLTTDIFGSRLNGKAFTLMCNQFSTILSAGIPIARAVRLIRDKTSDKKIQDLLDNVAVDVEAGRSISASFGDHGRAFLPPTFVETLRAGEESGSLANSFESIYRHFDKQTKMSDKVRAAMLYPLFVLFVAVVVVMVLMVQVVPTFTSIFEQQGAELPIMTQILIAVSTFIQHTFLYFIVAFILAAIGFLFFRRSNKGRMFLAKLQLSLPVLGEITELNAASLFANTMATMIGAGLPLTKSVAITSEVMENELIRRQSSEMVSKIEEGRTMVDAMGEAGCYPDILVDMVGVGEETGELKDTLDTVAKYYDNELELAVNRAIAMLEPSLLIFIAFIAGFIVVAIYLSMFGMYSNM